ncbi:hypothetical protein C8E03_102487 [Lachnotalea glycerini]|jgi:hypothetical protein|uniref:Uncharacterized protein n=1 Tax=Lachnotalea glycerini TaxID=1763509 RepID=A0A255I420_9FIRM|nr:hypothetical protein [Lachnotalea glycerini]PXV93712.1 hypothetical protein C8E03_102487 [Lachnotalea glycerini]RDY32655.1 hypothetical protein CG710_004305 [Lachnotalea glycerini]
MLKKPGILEMPDAATTLHGGELACSGNTCSSGYSCSSVDSSGGGDGCQVGFAAGGIVVGVAAGAAVGVAIT